MLCFVCFFLSTGRVEANNTGQLEITTIFQKYMILITIACVSEYSTAIGNKKLGGLPDARSRSPFLLLFGQKKKKKKRRTRGPRQDARGDKKLFFWPYTGESGLQNLAKPTSVMQSHVYVLLSSSLCSLFISSHWGRTCNESSPFQTIMCCLLADVLPSETIFFFNVHISEKS